jgi:hypothetical protein
MEIHMATATALKPSAPKQLPPLNSDFYQFAETLGADELAILKKVRAFMETKVAPIINKYWVKTLSRSSAMSRHLKLTAAILTIELTATATPVLAQRAPVGPFAGLSGYWIGAGTITMSNGSRERPRCKAVYAVKDTGKALNQSLRCASDSYRLEISSNVISNGGSLSGTWGEALRHATGNITGRASDAEIQASVGGAGFSAEVQVHYRGDRQSVSIRPGGGAEVADISLIDPAC